MKRGTPEHPKVGHLASLLNINHAWAMGILEAMWHFTARYAPQGDIGRHADLVIAKAVYWERPTGERGVKPECKLSGALVTARWLDTSTIHRLIVHDWSDHADEAVRKFLSRHSLDFVRTESSLPLPLPVPATDADPTFEQAMDRVPIQLREQVRMDFARHVFDAWSSVDGKNGAGVSCRFEKLLQKRWNAEGEQWRNGCHSAQKKPQSTQSLENQI